MTAPTGAERVDDTVRARPVERRADLPWAVGAAAVSSRRAPG
ncbi:hypothetical protein [Streptomyces sp. ISL-12]|nr:hypothetical protein [Streptomyces sp. ISL-12]